MTAVQERTEQGSRVELARALQACRAVAAHEDTNLSGLMNLHALSSWLIVGAAVEQAKP